jgi:hypothetical protein
VLYHVDKSNNDLIHRINREEEADVRGTDLLVTHSR